MSVETDNVQARDLQLEPPDNARLANLCGPLNEHLQQIERRLGVSIANRGHSFRITGLLQSARVADAVLRKMYAVTLEQQ